MAIEPEEGKRPGLHWPEHDLVPASRREDPEPEPVERAPERPAPEPAIPDEPLTASVLFTVASRLEALKTSLASMGTRIESLARSEEQFREFTTARLGEHTQQIADSMREISTQLSNHARTQSAALDDHAKTQTAAMASHAEAQSSAMSDLAETQSSALSGLAESQRSSFEGQAKAQSTAFEKMQSGIDESTRAAAEATEALDQARERIEEVGQALEVLTGQVQAVAEDVPSLRAELIDFIGRSDSRQEEMATELGRLVDEVKVLRRRLPVRAASSAAPAKRAPRPAPAPAEDEDDLLGEEPVAAPAPRRRGSRARRGD